MREGALLDPKCGGIHNNCLWSLLWPSLLTLRNSQQLLQTLPELCQEGGLCTDYSCPGNEGWRVISAFKYSFIRVGPEPLISAPAQTCPKFFCLSLIPSVRIRFYTQLLLASSSVHHSFLNLHTWGLPPSYFFKIHQKTLPKSLSVYSSFSHFFSAGGSKISLLFFSS